MSSTLSDVRSLWDFVEDYRKSHLSEMNDARIVLATHLPCWGEIQTFCQLGYVLAQFPSDEESAVVFEGLFPADLPTRDGKATSFRIEVRTGGTPDKSKTRYKWQIVLKGRGIEYDLNSGIESETITRNVGSFFSFLLG